MISRNKTVRLPFLVALLLSLAAFASVSLISGSSSDLALVDTSKNLRVAPGASTRTTYLATVSGATTTAAYNLEVESAVATGFKVTKICVSYALGATAAGTVITTTVRRTTAAGSGGTTCTANGTGVAAISSADGSGASYSGACRGLAGTVGTAGATLDQWSFPQTVVAGTTGITQPVVICQNYGTPAGDQALTVPVGTANGLAVNVSAGGAGSLATGAITMTLIAE